MGKMNGYRAENDEINREAFYGALSLTIFVFFCAVPTVLHSIALVVII
jgi:hypothetical protein